MYENKKVSILEANLIYLVLGFALLFIGYLVQTREVYSGLLITEFILILLPNLLYLKIKGYSLKEILRLNPISLVQVIFVIGIMIFAYPIAIFFNAIFLFIISSFSSALPTTVPIPTSSFEYLIGMFVIAVAPGICEEVMFRGTLLNAYDKFGSKKSILITAVLFGFFHFNIMNLVGPIFLGIILGILVHKTNSIYASIIGHTLNNGIALTIGYLITKYSMDIEELASNAPALPETTQMIISIISLGVLALISTGIIFLLFKYMPSFDKSLDINEYSEISFKEERFKTVKYFPIVIILIVFFVLNIRLLFYV